MAQAQLWLKTLRQAVKGDYGPGWILKEQYDRFKIGRAEAGNARHGKTQFVSTDLPFARGSHRKVLNLIGEMVAKMQDQKLNVGLAEAYELVRGSTEVTGAAINWEEVRSRYNRFGHGQGQQLRRARGISDQPSLCLDHGSHWCCARSWGAHAALCP